MVYRHTLCIRVCVMTRSSCCRDFLADLVGYPNGFLFLPSVGSVQYDCGTGYYFDACERYASSYNDTSSLTTHAPSRSLCGTPNAETCMVWFFFGGTQTWNYQSWFFWWGSIALFFSFISLYSLLVSYAYDFYYVAMQLMSRSAFWLIIIQVCLGDAVSVGVGGGGAVVFGAAIAAATVVVVVVVSGAAIAGGCGRRCCCGFGSG